jgi:hypothetical protein
MPGLPQEPHRGLNHGKNTPSMSCFRRPCRRRIGSELGGPAELGFARKPRLGLAVPICDHLEMAAKQTSNEAAGIATLNIRLSQGN